MKFFSTLLLACAAFAQQASPPATAAPAPPLPIKPGEWKLVAMIHSTNGDVARSFFSCVKETDLAHLVPQPANLPKGLTCTQDSQTVTAAGETLVISCKSASSSLTNTYELTRNTEQLVTGTMKMSGDVAGTHTESTTNIAYQWQQDECVNHDAKPAAKAPPSLNGPADSSASAPAGPAAK